MSSSKSYGSGKLSREDYKKQKDLEAARKAGTAPPEVDEEGKPINPHIPQFMAKAPWYMDTGKLGLQHQRKQTPETSSASTAWYARGKRVGEASKKYKKGACENCGAMSHKTKECVERPRKKGARWTGRDLKADEAVVQVALDYDAKRDRWNGYDAEEHRRLMGEWELVEEARRKRKASELDRKADGRGEGRSSAEDKDGAGIEAALGSSDEDSGREDVDEERLGAKSKSTVRNLRIREDTAKYLRNLDPDSAYYDPKTRSMRENPYAGKDPQLLAYAGDNFIRYSGEAQEIVQKDVFAWEAEARGNNSAHFQANPTQTALMYKDFRDKKDSLADRKRAAILEAYGGEVHLQAPPRELRMQQEHYVEYSRAGQIVLPSGRGEEAAPAAPRSRYREDVHPSNHKSVFGSWWCDGKWGYACCRQTMRNAYCTA
ncbi:mRNA splicing protein [Coemansia sp. RSA 2599]|nr:mRNA splicing protein [Coemansia sp. RSA 2598]KAJ1829320.1 mRNA splicing protein [Coemansia sp. RSA 2599]